MSRMKEFALPDLGEGLTEGEILAWLVKVGDTVELNQPIVEVETAKAAVEIPAKWAGKILTIHHEAGTVVEVGTPIITIDTDPSAGPVDAPVEAGKIGGEAPGGRTAVLVGYGPKTAAAVRRPRRAAGDTPTASRPPAATASAPPPPAAAATAPVVAPTPPSVASDSGTSFAAAASGLVASAPAAGARAGGPVLAKPPVRKLARDLGVDLATVTGSGPLGSITREDVQAALAGPATPAAPAGLNGSTPAGPAPAVFDASREQRVPVKGVRKLTAQNMVASAFTAPHVTMFHEVDVTRAVRALDKLKARRDWQDVKVSPLLLAARAVLLAVRRHPMMNSSWSGETNEIVVKEYVNLGIAAATERGLIVPNVKDAGRLSLRELAIALGELVATARAGRTSPADMSGGTFSITNVGVFGIDTGTPILPPGETAILCLGAIRPKPWEHKGKIKLRQVTTLGLSFDHRIVDGELGSRFLADVAAYLADPEGSTLAWS
jgi:pyruvate dehydrogenase E2 component (dihydrolipoamide acetyltransferase)